MRHPFDNRKYEMVRRCYVDGKRALMDEHGMVLWPGCGGWHIPSGEVRWLDKRRRTAVTMEEWGNYERLWRNPIIAWVFMH